MGTQNSKVEKPEDIQKFTPSGLIIGASTGTGLFQKEESQNTTNRNTTSTPKNELIPFNPFRGNTTNGTTSGGSFNGVGSLIPNVGTVTTKPLQVVDTSIKGVESSLKTVDKT